MPNLVPFPAEVLSGQSPKLNRILYNLSQDLESFLKYSWIAEVRVIGHVFIISWVFLKIHREGKNKKWGKISRKNLVTSITNQLPMQRITYSLESIYLSV